MGRRRTRFSEFAIRLREKQKVKRIYRLLEKQFAHYFEMAERMPGDHRRKPAGVARTAARQRGLSARLREFAARRRGNWSVTAISRSTARSVRSPSYLVGVDEVVSITEKSRRRRSSSKRSNWRSGAACRHGFARARAVPRLVAIAAGACGPDDADQRKADSRTLFKIVDGDAAAAEECRDGDEIIASRETNDAE